MQGNGAQPLVRKLGVRRVPGLAAVLKVELGEVLARHRAHPLDVGVGLAERARPALGLGRHQRDAVELVPWEANTAAASAGGLGLHLAAELGDVKGLGPDL